MTSPDAATHVILERVPEPSEEAMRETLRGYVTQQMLDAGIRILDDYDSLIHEMATTYDVFTSDRKSAELILIDVWQAMTKEWLRDRGQWVR